MYGVHTYYILWLLNLIFYIIIVILICSYLFIMRVYACACVCVSHGQEKSVKGNKINIVGRVIKTLYSLTYCFPFQNPFFIKKK